MHSCVTRKNVKWRNLIWPTQYIAANLNLEVIVPSLFVGSNREKCKRKGETGKDTATDIVANATGI